MRLLIAFGPTWEAIDPIRILTNRSTGTMGAALAKEALRRKHRVSCVVGPCPQKPLKGAKWIRVEDSREMAQALGKAFPSCDALVMAAAVSDYRPKKVSTKKLKRAGPLTLSLEATPDIVRGLARKKGKRLVVGFALESDRILPRAKQKLKEKKLDLLIANQIKKSGHPFGDRPVSVFLLDREGRMKKLRSISKQSLARQIIGYIEKTHGDVAKW